jgi:hypothetical protein
MISKASMFEVAVDEKLKEVPDRSPWLINNNDKKDLFESFIATSRYKEAWFTLNAKGWLLKDTAKALANLAAKANNELLSLVAEHWISGWQRSNYLNGSY